MESPSGKNKTDVIAVEDGITALNGKKASGQELEEGGKCGRKEEWM